MNYPIEIEPDDNDTLLVTCPDLPEMATDAEDEEDAVLRAADAIEEVLAARMDDRRPIPAPSPARGRLVARLPTLSSAKVELYRAMMADGVTKAKLGRLLGLADVQIQRMLDLNHATKIAQIEAALAALGRRVELTVERAA